MVLRYHPFYWNAAMRKSDAEIFFEMVRDSQVLVLGGGKQLSRPCPICEDGGDPLRQR